MSYLIEEVNCTEPSPQLVFPDNTFNNLDTSDDTGFYLALEDPQDVPLVIMAHASFIAPGSNLIEKLIINYFEQVHLYLLSTVKLKFYKSEQIHI
jgi:hypothetical protein